MRKIKCLEKLRLHPVHSVSGVHHAEAKQHGHEANANLSGAYLVHVALKNTAGSPLGFRHTLGEHLNEHPRLTTAKAETFRKHSKRKKMKQNNVC